MAGEAAAKGAHIILLQELFATTYFPMDQADHFRLAVGSDDDRCYLSTFKNLAKELEVVLPISFYERAKYVSVMSSTELHFVPISLQRSSASNIWFSFRSSLLSSDLDR